MNYWRGNEPLVAGNWKLNKNLDETKQFVKQFSELINKKSELNNFLIFPPALNITTLIHSMSSSNSPIDWGAQNVYCEASGAFTGENSASVIKQLGARFALIGHSERRTLFGETDGLIAKKVKYVQELDLVPMLCVGESLEEREQGKTKEVVLKQIEDGLVSFNSNKNVVVAYEPVWAIGTGKVAEPEDAEAVHADIRGFMTEKWGKDFAQKTPILYGGSVKPGNAKELWQQDNIDGFLVGGASLDPQSFADIYKNCVG